MRRSHWSKNSLKKKPKRLEPLFLHQKQSLKDAFSIDKGELLKKLEIFCIPAVNVYKKIQDGRPMVALTQVPTLLSDMGVTP